MTTVAYRSGVIACDSGMTIGGTRVGLTTKIAVHPEHGLAGAAGGAAWAASFLEWHRKGQQGQPPEAKQDDSSIDRGIVIRRDAPATIHVFEAGGWFKCYADFYALGSGRDIAMGVFWKGGGAIEAVKAGVEFDSGTFGMVRMLEFSSEASEARESR